MAATTLTIPLLDFEIPSNVVILGLVSGCTYGLIGAGLTLVYRTSRVLNLAAGEMGALAALILPLLAVNYGWPYWVAAPVALASGLVLGGLVELLVIRRLQRAPRLTTLVATLGLAQALLGISILLPQAGQLVGQTYPVPFEARVTAGSLVLGPGQLMILAGAPLVVVSLAWFLRRSPLGRASRAAADNLEAAQLAGVPTARVSLAIWSIAGLLAAVAAILAGPTRPVALAAALGPGLLLRALGASMVGRLVSVPKTFAGGLVIGVLEALVLWNYPIGGVLEVVLAGFVIACLLLQRSGGRLAAVSPTARWTQGTGVRPLARSVAFLPPVRRARAGTIVVLVVLAAAIPVAIKPSTQFLLTSVLLHGLMAISLVVLTGYSGHISLGQFGFVAVGAAVGGRLYQLGLPHVAAAVGVMVVGGLVALVVGLPALRVRGLFLAVTTLGFALVASAWLFHQDWLVTSTGTSSSSLRIPRPELFGIDFNRELAYYWVCLAVVLAVAAVVSRLRHSGLGRSLIAVRDNEASAASLSLPTRRLKLVAFVVSGVIASLGGFLYGVLLTNFSSDPSATFGAEGSLRLMVAAVLGGVGSITGVLLGVGWVEGIPQLLGEGYALVSSGLGLVLVVLLLPGGLAEVAFALRDRAVAWLTRDRPTGEASGSSGSSDPVEATVPAGRGLAGLAAGRAEASGSLVPIRADGVSVRFGGLQALRDVSVHAARGEIVGLMGPNGAGKTTLFDVLSGQIRPSTGVVRLDDRTVTSWPVHIRARAGLGRTHQQARLFGALTVVEAVSVGVERELPTHPVGSLLGTPGARRVEHRQRAAATELVERLELGPYAHQRVETLPTGTRRLVELACVVALDAHVLLLDEPTAGLAPDEVESFTRIIREVRDHLGATVVVIDHAVPLMRSLVDRLYVLEAGAVIAEGPVSILDEDDRVAEAYLGRRSHWSYIDPRSVNKVYSLSEPDGGGTPDVANGAGELGRLPRPGARRPVAPDPAGGPG